MKKIISKSTNPSIQHSIPQTKDLILYGVEIYIIINIWYEIVASPSECQKEREGAEPVVSNSTDRPDHTEREWNKTTSPGPKGHPTLVDLGKKK